MSDSRVRLGRQGEELAVRELKRRGYEIEARNWRCRAGEADVVACRDDVWTFFEVRTRRGLAYGTPEESLTEEKKDRMLHVALAFLAENGLVANDWRLGFVAVEMDRSGRLMRVEVYDTIG